MPLPASKLVMCSVPEGATVENVRVYSLLGELVPVGVQNLGTMAMLDIAALPVGVYTVRVETPHGVATRLLQVIR